MAIRILRKSEILTRTNPNAYFRGVFVGSGDVALAADRLGSVITADHLALRNIVILARQGHAQQDLELELLAWQECAAEKRNREALLAQRQQEFSTCKHERISVFYDDDDQHEKTFEGESHGHSACLDCDGEAKNIGYSDEDGVVGAFPANWYIRNDWPSQKRWLAKHDPRYAVEDYPWQITAPSATAASI